MRYYVTVGDRTHEVELEGGALRVDGHELEAELRRIPGTRVHSLLLDGASHRVVARRNGSGDWQLHVGTRRLQAAVVDERTKAIREMTGAGAGGLGPRPLRAPMPGLVVKVEVEEGDEVVPGQGLAIVEAMKMENELVAEAAGTVARIRVTAGEAVDKDQVLIDFADPEADIDASGEEG